MAKIDINTGEMHQFILSEMNLVFQKTKDKLISEYQAQLAKELTKIAIKYSIRLEQSKDLYDNILLTKIIVEVPDGEKTSKAEDSG